MDSDTFKTHTIYKILKKEYELLEVQGDYIGFIASKDLGIKCLDVNLIENRRVVDRYKIIDEKKWALSKIKYGF